MTTNHSAEKEKLVMVLGYSRQHELCGLSRLLCTQVHVGVSCGGVLNDSCHCVEWVGGEYMHVCM